MISLGKRIAHHSICYGVQSAKWLQQDLTLDWEIAPHDLVTASYVLGELNEDDREEFIAKLWQSTNDVLLIVEPGTPQGFARLRTVRKQLIEEGAIVIAPCPHNSSCAISGEDWCHFSQRIDRTSIHRKVKGGHLSYEDEKFSFLAAARTPGKAVFGRILRHPQIRKGHVIFDICSSAGISQQIVSRKQQEQYKTAKKLRWGSILEQPDDQA